MDVVPLPSCSRRGWLASAIAFAASLGGCAAVPAQRGIPSIARFSACGPHDIVPGGWEAYVLRRDLPLTDYHVAELDGRRVLRATAKGASSGLRYPLAAHAQLTPWLRWDWRTDNVPAGMSVGNSDTDDSPARVAVAFDGDTADLPLKDRAFFDFVELITGQRLPYATLMYVWDAHLPVGTVVSYGRSSRIRYVVAESGAARAGHWLSQERNLQTDFERIFGEHPGAIRSVGVLTDGDDLKVDVEAWYGDIRLDAA